MPQARLIPLARSGIVPAPDSGVDWGLDGGPGGSRTRCTPGELFQPVETYAVGSGPAGVAVADLNRDGRLDLAVVDVAQDAVWVLLGQGDGTFGSPVGYPAGGSGWSVAQADINADGVPDLVVANGLADQVSVLLGDGSGGFGRPSSFPASTGPVCVLLADLNGDGRPDIVVSNDSTQGAVTVLLATATGFASPVDYAVGNATMFVVARDFDGDGILDLLAASDGEDALSLLHGVGDGTFGAAQPFGASTEYGPRSIGVGDFNGDGILDAAAADGYRSVAVVVGPPSATEAPTIYSFGTNPESVAVADFDGDGILDLAVAEANGYSDGRPGTLEILLGQGDGTFTQVTSLTVGIAPEFLLAVDLNGDGKPDLVSANAWSGSISVILNGCP